MTTCLISNHDFTVYKIKVMNRTIEPIKTIGVHVQSSKLLSAAEFTLAFLDSLINTES